MSFYVVNFLNTAQIGSFEQEYTVINEKTENLHKKRLIYVADCPKSTKKLTENGSHLEFLINT